MASEKQIAANRKNARKSTGPRTNAGKQRAAKNARRYGLSIQTDEGENAQAIESLARRIVEGVKDQHLLQCARSAAHAHLELARIRQVKRDIIDGLARVEACGPAARFGRDVERRLLKALSNAPMKKLKPVDWLLPPLSRAELEAEALQRLLPELRKLERYEKRAFNMKNQALREIAERLILQRNTS
ncbi:hypothetical protein ACH79_42315 [Bradyrhizobium sp. CCBAU 051011]|uniref:hypothetical protein n=1 Tax=Bradyrhizobium sp. CCBAU 051011 TaxID=858422 RepID=UPI001373A74A|nr:hypothetical protein [Bradyrhizobium sp. CCBAU 051011]QHO78241.1 hypothetical protein ACH79_42315 [Bradyrhizobium sp. CCBAU 051011]